VQLTRQHIAAAFPVLQLATNAPAQQFEHLLAAEFSAWTDNIEYAADLATVVMSHVTNGLYSALPHKLQTYRASLDIFLEVAPEDRSHLYIRAVAKASALRRSAMRFHQSLLATAREYDLPVPDSMTVAFSAPASVSCRTRLPTPVYLRLQAQARATNTSISEIIRERVLAKDGTDDGEDDT